jgi:uncharacterized protein (DUF169 family)
MTDYAAFAQSLTAALGPVSLVSVAFVDAAPAGSQKFEGARPSGCSFWSLAAEGRIFHTVPSDHYNCPIGSYTHAIELPDARASELTGTIEFMTGIGYIRLEEVPGIPRLAKTPAVIAYAPLASTLAAPDVVIVKGQPGPLMRLQEAALRAGAAASLPPLGRPTCMALPAALAGGAVASTGCIGNRVYTGAGEDELYVAVAGRDIARVADETETIARANAALADYHRGRRATLATE